MRIAIVTDAYFPQVSGVATTIRATANELEEMGHQVLIVGPYDFRFRIPMPGYTEIQLALFAGRALAKKLDAFHPESIHISVEGPLGLEARAYAKKHGLKFSTAYHTRFPEYVHVRTGIPTEWLYAYLRWFHNGGSVIMVAAENLKQELESHGFKNIALWGRGVDTDTFNADNTLPLKGEKPIFMYMGRVAVEKNLEAFLKLDLPGTKYVVGDGPSRKTFEKRYPKAVFTGYKFGQDLAQHLASADVFVFPSLTDTLGLVMLEANACGLPVAALPSQAAHVVVKEGENGIVSADLRDACLRALKLSREKAREAALAKSWRASTEQFLNNLHINERA